VLLVHVNTTAKEAVSNRKNSRVRRVRDIVVVSGTYAQLGVMDFNYDESKAYLCWLDDKPGI
jgi:hypothetical protein